MKITAKRCILICVILTMIVLDCNYWQEKGALLLNIQQVMEDDDWSADDHEQSLFAVKKHTITHVAGIPVIPWRSIEFYDKVG